MGSPDLCWIGGKSGDIEGLFSSFLELVCTNVFLKSLVELAKHMVRSSLARQRGGKLLINTYPRSQKYSHQKAIKQESC